MRIAISGRIATPVLSTKTSGWRRFALFGPTGWGKAGLSSRGLDKKTGVVENPQVLDHAGLLFDGPTQGWVRPSSRLPTYANILERLSGRAALPPTNTFHTSLCD